MHSWRRKTRCGISGIEQWPYDWVICEQVILDIVRWENIGSILCIGNELSRSKTRTLWNARTEGNSCWLGRVGGENLISVSQVRLKSSKRLVSNRTFGWEWKVVWSDRPYQRHNSSREEPWRPSDLGQLRGWCRCRRAVQQFQLRSADDKQTVLEVGDGWSRSVP